jgi:signal transduction histidine kinase
VKELLPTWDANNKCDGFLIKINQRCIKCIYNSCKDNKSTDVLLECPHGFNYLKSETRIYFGILISEINPSKQKRESIYKFPDCVITKSLFDNYVLFNKDISKEIDEYIKYEKEKTIKEYVRNNLYKEEFFTEIKKTADQNFSFFHDYQQINGTINRNINVIIIDKTKCTGEITDDILAKCSQNEVAIYYASQILEEKLNVAKAMCDFAWINRTSENKRFNVYGCVLKYVRMYKSISDQKKISLDMSGKSYREIIKNPKAFSIIPHTFIDNAIKYSPKSDRITIYINDESEYIDFYVKSLGPKITEKERDKIFVPFYRGEYAKKLEEDGSGYGLYVAQRIAKEHLNSEINVKQNESLESLKEDYFETIFSLRIPLN